MSSVSYTTSPLSAPSLSASSLVSSLSPARLAEPAVAAGRRGLGGSLRALRAFATAACEVALLGARDERAGVAPGLRHLAECAPGDHRT
ncbi:hypothetical protein [Streptomyces sp. SPB074]|uniref:hypothetical protein n=1 Tax=Streptomyces sp. (strain SPB074) TaxID=465543 RepID=UPI0001D1E140|nr:hypothetical protein [Streptomyces sp. SPB074]EFG65123.1 hypothetical protein SSBG_05933 [Streptomyces sp. SPB074]